MEIDELIEKFSTQTLHAQIIDDTTDSHYKRTPGVQAVDVAASKKERTTTLKNKCTEYGIKALLRLCSRDELTILYEPYEEEEAQRTKMFLIRRLKSKIMDLGLDNYCKKAKSATIDIINKYVTTPKENFGTGVPDELRKAGFEMLLWETPVATLQKMCVESKIKVESQVASVLIKALLTGKVPKVKRTKAAVVEYSEEKLPLSAELTFHDIFQHYNLDELRVFCAKKKIKVSGTKPEVIKRIMSYFDGTYVAPQPRVAKPKKPDTAVKKTTKTTKTTTAVAPVEEEEEDEGEEEVDSEDEDDEEDEVPPPTQKVQKKGVVAPVEEEEEDDEDDEDDEVNVPVKPVTRVSTGKAAAAAAKPIVPAEKAPATKTTPKSTKSPIVRKA
ncbi:hypothetical protein SAMD00019534_046690 [Acytostelium subglobosum LB1]|uniref:hypothetical protein n=1 Tax=Acytostelium subglobosum LB1 TaxID=1410327 RepID=UPI000644E6B4|nr:hypothetical protein SAMD00019534_046690 [Acytostelium subglobosum LB1]GAM21494.1 hypothetical protein SAMD00019534_046690 [Acytostelium subglobosum LB1]|eukprot:XP_012755613.1 hypothetical protein SAMD00019534_046690 [Acytostelium subglobosum LB1]